MKTDTLRFQINFAIVTAVLFLALFFGGIFLLIEHDGRTAQMRKINVMLATLFAQQKEELANEIFSNQINSVTQTLKDMAAAEEIVMVSLFDVEGELVASSKKNAPAYIPEYERNLLNEQPLFEKSRLGNLSVAVYSTAVNIIGEQFGYFQIYYDLSTMEQHTRRMIILLSIFFMTTIVLMSWLLNTMLSRFVIRPVTLLRNSMLRVQQGHVGERTKVSTRGEIGEMAFVFNDMSQKLKSSHEHLEHMIDERTAQLQKSNERLKREIEQRKSVECELLQAKDAAEAANRAKSIFLANMSHEIRTPLNAILGMSEILTDSGVSPQQENYLRTIHSSGKTLLRIIEDLLDLSRIEAGKLEIQREPLSIRQILQDIGLTFIKQLHQKDVVLRTKVDDKVPERLMLDSVRIKQVLANLTGNAVKFTEAGYIKLSVEVDRVHLNKTIDLGLTVEDTGIGIAPDQKELIFESFHQQDADISRRYGGTGLGLSIAKSLIELMGGVISVESELGKGTTFKLKLFNVETVETLETAQGADSDEDRDDIEVRLPISKKQKAELSEMLLHFKSAIWPKWTEINESFFIDDVSVLALEMVLLAQQYNAPDLQSYAEQLYRHSQSNDIGDIEQMLNNLPKIVSKIESYL
ncbi:MAG: ATP-binding protein [Desulforhabdus sp.]|nr:ATP-binding protein [Desulforhabdus sp.]